MGFVRPELFWLLLLLVPLLIASLRDRRRRRRNWQALAQRGRPPRTGGFRVVACVALIIVALAQPRWGRLRGPAPPPGHDVVLVIDVSRSMAAEDAVPNRLAVAIESARSLVNALAGDPANRAAVVAFAGRAVLRCPLTENLGAVLDALSRLKPNAVQPGGTDLGAALDAALEGADTEEHADGRAIVVFSDGEDLADQWSARVEKLRSHDVVVHAVTIGDADEGHSIPIGPSDTESLTYHGQPVLSRRSDEALGAVTRRTGGILVPLGLASADLGALYQTKIEPSARRRRDYVRPIDRAEGFGPFLVGAVVLLLASSWPSRRGWALAWPWRAHTHWRPSTARLGRSLCVVLAAGALVGAGDDGRPTGPAKSAAEAVARGRAAYDSRRFDDALAEFDRARDLAPNLAIPDYNAAAALFQLGRYDEARQRYRRARDLADGALRVKIDYALGNSALAAGDVTAAIASYDECLASTSGGAALDRVRSDARINRQFALSHPRSPALSDGDRDADPPRSERPDRQRRAPRGDGDGNDESNGLPPEIDQGGGGDASDEPEPPPARRHRAGGGGAGGAGGGQSKSTADAPGDSPNDRLDAALDHIKAAQNRRLIDEPPPATANDDRRDW